MTPEELAGAKDFENWMIEEEKRMKGIIIEMPVKTDNRRLLMFREQIKKPDFVFKRQGQLSLF